MSAVWYSCEARPSWSMGAASGHMLMLGLATGSIRNRLAVNSGMVTFLSARAGQIEEPAMVKLPARYDHVGSFLRPAYLLAARDKRARGEISAEALRAVEDQAIAEIVRFQQD